MTKIKFTTQKELLAHPQARLIPDQLWEHWDFFINGIDPLLLSLMQTSNEELVNRFSELNVFNNEDDKRKTWIALVLSHPSLSQELVQSITAQLNLSPEEELLLTCMWGNLSYFEYLYIRYNPKEENNSPASWAEPFFFGAASYGHVTIVKYLEKKITEAELQEMIRADKDHLFRWAALHNYLGILLYLEDKVSNKEFQKMIQVLDYQPFRNAAKRGHLEVLQYLGSKASKQIVLKMIKVKDYESFGDAAFGGYIEILLYMESIVSKKSFRKMIAAGDHVPFRNAAKKGHIDILEYLEKNAPQDLQNMIKAEDYEAFRHAAANGHLVSLQYMGSKVSAETLQKMIQAKNYISFSLAALNGHLEVLHYLESKVSKETLQKMIQAADYKAFRDAAGSDHLLTLNYLESKVSKDVLQVMLQAQNYSAFHQTCSSEVISYLLQFNSVLGHAEAHDQEYANKVRPHIDGLLKALRLQKIEFENTHPQAVFDVSEEEAMRYFYCIRNLIRRGVVPRDELILLLDIPAVKAKVHKGSNPNESNELLRLALNTQNREAAELLLEVRAVRELTVANNYYREEIAGGLDAGILAQDNESSMRGLSLGEQRRLSTLLEHYKAELESKKISEVIEGLRSLLKTRYLAKPAYVIKSEGTIINLPLERSEFEKLLLEGEERQLALKVYYQHKDHSALRYLSKPNYWMHAAAAYVNVNPGNTKERWSTYDEYQGLIALFYLAARDEKTPSHDGFSVADRLRHFIDELALIGRAHNWDKSRAKGNGLEEYDDCEGDMPSCYSGVKRRLFQSLMGHPLMLILTTEKLKDELRVFGRDHFKELITEDRKPLLKAAWDNVVRLEELSEADKAALKELDILPEQQKKFIDYLDNKYPNQFSEDFGFKYQIEDAFVLKRANDSHACSSVFSNTRWQQFLESPPALVEVQKFLLPEKLKMSFSLPHFLRLLDGLKMKQEYYLVHHQGAYEQVQKIVNALESKAKVFYDNPNPVLVNDFKQECIEILNKNGSVLREHRALFGAFFTAIHQFFIALQALLLNEPTRHRFFDNRPHGARVVDALVENIQRFSIEVC